MPDDARTLLREARSLIIRLPCERPCPACDLRDRIDAYLAADEGDRDLRTRLAALEAENERLCPPPGRDGTTRWETCWQARGHHACAIGHVRRAEQRVAELERVVEAAKRLLRSECPEEGRIDTSPDPTCPRCTSGTTPDAINRGLCPLHGLVAALDGAEGRAHPAGGGE